MPNISQPIDIPPTYSPLISYQLSVSTILIPTLFPPLTPLPPLPIYPGCHYGVFLFVAPLKSPSSIMTVSMTMSPYTTRSSSPPSILMNSLMTLAYITSLASYMPISTTSASSCVYMSTSLIASSTASTKPLLSATSLASPIPSLTVSPSRVTLGYLMPSLMI